MTADFQAFVTAGALTDGDLRFAKAIARLGGETRPPVLLAAALACRAPRHGHVCLDLTAPARAIRTEGAQLEGLEWPGPDAWLDALATSPLVGTPDQATTPPASGETRPLILDGNHLYLHRYHAYQDRLATAIEQRLSAPALRDADEDLDARFARLLPTANPEQREAVQRALRRRFLVIAGGPGTGKTWTVLRVLALLLELEDTPPRIVMVAPSGKAAARLNETILDGLDSLALSEDLKARIRPDASTIHRAMGVRGTLNRFWRSADDPLDADVVIVDEASMVDIALMTKLVEATPLDARLILLGDRDQLASVEAGAVLGDLCNAGGQPPPTPPPIAESLVVLKTSRRFDEHGDIGRLARAVNGGDPTEVLALLASELEHVQWLKPEEDALPKAADTLLVAAYTPMLEAARAGEVASALERVGAFRALCAHRSGALGVRGVNARVEALLEDRDLAAPDSDYPGRPLLIRRNDYDLDLRNGDVGVIVNGDPHAKAWFDGPEGPRAFAPGRLPEHQTVYAMTIHKSQGSEFDHVMVVLPYEPSALLTSELLYTAVTRAKTRVTLVATEAAVEQAVRERILRLSGLRDRLWR